MKRLALTIALLAASAAPAQAAPGDYTITYDWTGANHGFVGWSQFEVPALGQPGTPFYAARLALPKLRIAPSPAADGTTDRTYPAVEGPLFGPRRPTVVQAPGTTRIRSATFDDVDYLRTSNERQFLRLAVYGDSSAVDADNVYDFRPDAPPNGGAPGSYQNDVTYTGVGPATVDPAEPGLSAQVWMLTSCDPSCPFVQFGPGGAPRSYGQLGRVQLDLFDPEAPAVSTAGPLTSGGWTNGREPRAATVASSDPGAGMRAISATRERQAGGAVTVLNQGSDCDRTHTRLVGGPGREAAPCPDQLNSSFSQSLGALPDGEYTYTVTATDDSDRTSTSSFVVRLDRTRPGTVTGSGPLRSLMGRWTNRTDKPSLLVRGRDTRAGIRSLEIVADVGGAGRIVATADLGCTTSCPSSYTANLFSDLNALPDGRVPISVRATDAAGNVTERPVGRCCSTAWRPRRRSWRPAPSAPRPFWRSRLRPIRRPAPAWPASWRATARLRTPPCVPCASRRRTARYAPAGRAPASPPASRATSECAASTAPATPAPRSPRGRGPSAAARRSRTPPSSGRRRSAR
jgi:hypothetical protein